ncbi:MAG: CbiX/SirB N-terminal domain-containing protein [Verrucomicrobiota bacterium]
MNFKDAALVVAGHGSTLNADSSAPTYQHADEIRKRNLFAEVHEAFWKEEPHFRDVLRQIDADHVYIVPNFVSEGYFTETVLPREFGLHSRECQLDGKKVCYCDPVGIHPSMTKVLRHRAKTVIGKKRVDLQDTCLFIVGHGTSLNQNSTKVIYDQVELFKEMKLYGDCQASFMEQEPFISDWKTLTHKTNVIVVPFFIADGLHSYEDIPVLLGISTDVREQGFETFNHIDGRQLWYSRAIGTENLIADVILQQVKDFHENSASLPI